MFLYLNARFGNDTSVSTDEFAAIIVKNEKDTANASNEDDGTSNDAFSDNDGDESIHEQQNAPDFFTKELFKPSPPFGATADSSTDITDDASTNNVTTIEAPYALALQDIIALASVAYTFCQPSDYLTAITMQDAEAKLYQDKQDSIPVHALQTTATWSMLSPQLRWLRSVIVQLAGDKAKRSAFKLTLAKQKDSKDTDAIRIDHATLYRMLSISHNMFHTNGAEKMTSANTFKTKEQKLYAINNSSN
ncbi:hypothetical protein MAM1_0053d03461 [Mucor ambiguus]|uniref:Uncharacterized protein n=1 Tax=Mucor ambiguus TaxID=91626 RepID=A0A0C9LTT1_9FUNG|nr:hypothetical protein MAM1_0053d03461 [Mucor ambiguus]